MQKWKYATAQQNTYQPAIDSAGIVYVASKDGKIHAVRSTGQPLWVKDVFGSFYFHNGPVIAVDGSVLIDGPNGLMTFQDGGVGVPSILHMTASPDPNNAGNLNLSAFAVADAPGGTVALVLFYGDANANGQLDVDDTLLGTDVSGSEFPTLSVSAPAEVGNYTYFAQAADNDGHVSNVVAATYTVGSALHTAGLALPDRAPSLESLTEEALAPVVHEALRRWQLADADAWALKDVRVRIADLGGNTLGLAAGSTIVLDRDAAGWGWFVDATPWNDSEYLTPGNQGEQGRMDLLTAIAHELGHLLGYEHSDDGTMHNTLAASERHTPTPILGPVEPAVFDLIFIEEKDKKTTWSSDRLAHDLLSDLALPPVR